MIWALLNDLFQRLITFNKHEQRAMLRRQVKCLKRSPGSKALDFGCGTGLFSTVFLKAGYRYWGYDIDTRLLEYARFLYPAGNFTRSVSRLQEEGPFDLIIANCCFHHIGDEMLIVELDRICNLLSDDGVFIMKDLLWVENDTSKLHRAFMKLEQGHHVRPLEEYRRMVATVFDVFRVEIERSHVLSLRHRLNPLHNDLAVLMCRKSDRVSGRSQSY
jgi:2-polyprenyl-3-methyl-5-hydroxy-6-metoxy-1,4-benzoquinol methylase